MRRPEERREVRRLCDAGLNASQISRRTGISRSTIRDWLAPRAVVPSYDSCEQCGHPVHDFAALPASEYAYLLGFYLGDGAISPGPKGVYALRIVNDARYVGVTAEVALAMAVVMPRNHVGFIQRPGCVEIVSRSKSWPCLFPQHGPGRKHERFIDLALWQADVVGRRPQQFVRGLLHSDGCRITNWASARGGRRYEYPRYVFSNKSDDIRELFCLVLRLLGVAYTRPRWDLISIARAESVRRLDRFVGAKA
jgi:Homeodomain-like domain